MNVLLWNPSFWRPYKEKLRARISLAWNDFSTDFSKLYSINRSWGCKYPSSPTSAACSQVFTRILCLSRKSGASCGCFFLLLYIQPVMPGGARLRDILCPKHFGLNTHHSGPLFATRSLHEFEILPASDPLYLLNTTKLWCLLFWTSHCGIFNCSFFFCAYLTLVNTSCVWGEKPRLYRHCFTTWMLKWRKKKSPESNQQTNTAICAHSWGLTAPKPPETWPSATRCVWKGHWFGKGTSGGTRSLMPSAWPPHNHSHCNKSSHTCQTHKPRLWWVSVSNLLQQMPTFVSSRLFQKASAHLISSPFCAG